MSKVKKSQETLVKIESYAHVKYTFQGTNISPFKGTFEDDFPFPKVGYISSLHGIFILQIYGNYRAKFFFFW